MKWFFFFRILHFQNQWFIHFFFEIVIAMRSDLHTKLECYCYFTYVVLYCAFKYFSTWRWNLGTYFFVSHRKWDVSFSSWYDDKGFENKVRSYVKCKKDCNKSKSMGVKPNILYAIVPIKNLLKLHSTYIHIKLFSTQLKIKIPNNCAKVYIIDN